MFPPFKALAVEARVRGFQIEQVVQLSATTDRTFVYFADRYALLLLAWAAGRDGSVRVRELRESRFAALIQKPAVRRLLATAGSGALSADALRRARPRCVQTYRIGLSQWGAADEADWIPSYHQTTRPGLNLVLQLNFTRAHNRAYYALLQPNGRHPFVCGGHPNAEEQLTMAWVRIDLELDAGEALIEEVQSDWIKYALLEQGRHEDSTDDPEATSATGVHPWLVRSYIESVLGPHVDTWAEAALSAAIELVRGTLGIRRIFFNTFETGCYLKDHEDFGPPRWIYSRLPRKFCFRRTHERPRALSRSKHPMLREKLRRNGLEWMLLELD